MNSTFTLRWITIILSISPIFIGVIFSTGFYQADELFQNFEFAQLTVNESNDQYMPWEYHHQIRSTWLVWAATILLKIANALGLDGKGALMLSRMVTATAGLVLLAQFSNYLLDSCKSTAGRIAARWLPVTFWILPFLLNRFSGEILAMYLLIALLLLAASWENKPTNRKLLALGVTLMIAFFVRHAIVLALVPFLLWFLIRNKATFEHIKLIIIGSVAAGLVSMALDSLYYGQWVCTPYNYFTANFVENKAANFGIYPWHFYFTGMVDRLGWSMTATFIALALGTLTKARSYPLFWMILVSVLGYSLIGHKELRFLFSLVPFAVAGLVWIIDKVDKPVGKILAYAVIGINVAFGATLGSMPADDGLSNVNSFISQEKIPGPIFIQAIDIHPFSPHGLVSRTYSNPRLKCRFLPDESDIFELKSGSVLICHEDFISRLKDENVQFEILKIGYSDIFASLHRKDLSRRVNLLRLE